jgi:hypothetical protein
VACPGRLRRRRFPNRHGRAHRVYVAHVLALAVPLALPVPSSSALTRSGEAFTAPGSALTRSSEAFTATPGGTCRDVLRELQ